MTLAGVPLQLISHWKIGHLVSAVPQSVHEVAAHDACLSTAVAFGDGAKADSNR